MSTGQILPNPFRSPDEVQSVVVVLLNACSHGKHIGVEDDIAWWKSDFIDQNVVGTTADVDFTFIGCGLSFLIKSHDDDSGSQTFNFTGMLDEQAFTFLQRDGIDNTFALHAFQSCTDDFPVG